MKQHVEHLATIARKPSRMILGLMSGTSLDGLDIALCALEGSGLDTRVRVLHFDTTPYDEPFRAEVHRVFAQKNIDFQHLVLLNVVIAERHAAIVNATLSRWGVPAGSVDLIASHGQTVFHAPRHFHALPDYPNATLQIGDGDHIARRTGIITISDFRQKHLAAGGEGAPLALYGDYLLFSKKEEDRFLLNIGGIANFTFLPGDGDPAKVFATDTGPGNTLLDAAARQFFGQPCDMDARLAGAGQVDEALLGRLKNHPYFARAFPTTTGPEQFSLAWAVHDTKYEENNAAGQHTDACNLLATLTRLTADTIAEGILRVPRTTERAAVYRSGGGAHNPMLTALLQEKLPGWEIQPMSALGVHGDAKEAVLFAVLANETVAGQTTPGAQLAGLPLVGMGKVSFPG
ncbi:MAG: anhydro-N-acetylmuramic acid kinase [Lewinellaceae bacterium]|nr:anhydro-N-acetylmuramic acid kinase [Lewinellaceae bacterium]